MEIFSHHNTNKKVHLLCAFLFVLLNSWSQNLVPNPSFELYTQCLPGSISIALPWTTSISNGYPSEYCNACINSNCCSVPSNTFGFSYQYAHTGNAYSYLYFIGPFGSNFRNYEQIKLLDTLKAGYCYEIEFYVNFADCYQLACNNISLLLTDTATYIPSSGKFIHANPQIIQYRNPVIKDTLNWVKVGGIYTAHGGEKYITIGNFSDDAHTDTLQFPTNIKTGGGYYIDDVSVIPLDSMQLKADAGRDTTIVKGDSVWIGSRLCGLTNVVWYDAANNVIDTGAPGLWVKPTSNTFYVIEQDVCGQYSRDTVYISVAPLPVLLAHYSLSPSFGGGGEVVSNQWTTTTEINTVYFNIQRSTDGIIFNTVGTVKAKGASIYTFNDPLSNQDSRFTKLYYRLEIVDNNGSKTYSYIRSVFLNTDDSRCTISPNPAKDYINISGENIKSVQISDVHGKLILKSIKSRIDIKSLIPGVYYASIHYINGSKEVKEFVKL